MPRDPSNPDPIAQLERSHRRIEEACAALRTAAQGRDIETAAEISAFFARQVRRHEEDEEASVFPRLLALPGVHTEAATRVRATIVRLTAEHGVHAELQARLDALVTGRDASPGDLWENVAQVAEQLSTSYAAHIAEEETNLFPIARAALDHAAAEAIFVEMDARRGRGRG